MPLVWSRKSPQYLKFFRHKRQEKYQSYQATKKRYHLNISDSILEQQASQYAKHKANSHFQVFSDIFKGENLFNFIDNLVSLIAGVALSVVSFGSSSAVSIAALSTSITASVANFGVSVAQDVININAQNAQSFYAQASSSLQQATSMAKTLNDKQNHIAHNLIYKPYAIFPEGHIYKGENPGSLGYKAGLEGFSPMKGILGQPTDNRQAEGLNNRAHRHLAGNADYDPLNLPFPKAEFKENDKDTLETYKRNLERRMEEIKSGFKELSGDYFGAFDTQITQRLFNEHMHKDIHPRINQINAYRFLDQMRYYAKGERLPLFEKMPYPNALKLPQSEFGQYGEIKLESTDEYGAIQYTYLFDYQGVLLEAYKEWDTPYIEPPKDDGRGVVTSFRHHKENLHNKGDLVVLVRQQKKGTTLPTKSPAVLQYEAIKDLENPDMPLEEEFKLKEAYNAYVKAYWDCFGIEVLTATPKRPLEYAQAQRKDLKNVFFNTTQEPLSALELEKQTMFKEFVAYYRLVQDEGDMG
ncbi:hypothetical protein [Helicobacter bizzozeronii]|uniref:hypothetical protein n=1 Tax=Helicobacter bizzozeronii TaxID=56877 RepID=UPI001F2D59CA|nr:hypothetical protein [Helicobacter bizzozeronii]